MLLKRSSHHRDHSPQLFAANFPLMRKNNKAFTLAELSVILHFHLFYGFSYNCKSHCLVQYFFYASDSVRALKTGRSDNSYTLWGRFRITGTCEDFRWFLIRKDHKCKTSRFSCIRLAFEQTDELSLIRDTMLLMGRHCGDKHVATRCSRSRSTGWLSRDWRMFSCSNDQTLK